MSYFEKRVVVLEKWRDASPFDILAEVLSKIEEASMLLSCLQGRDWLGAGSTIDTDEKSLLWRVADSTLDGSRINVQALLRVYEKEREDPSGKLYRTDSYQWRKKAEEQAEKDAQSRNKKE